MKFVPIYEQLEIPSFSQPSLIVGYQYGPDGLYAGEFEFHNNQDKEEIHMPPNTTLITPPKSEDKKDAYWDSLQKKWLLKDKVQLISLSQLAIEVETQKELNESLLNIIPHVS